MATPMDVSVVTPEKRVWHGEAEMVVGRSPEGEFAIMANHIPFLAALVPGRVTIHGEGSERTFVVPGGFLEASGSDGDYHVIVLADDAEETSGADFAQSQARAKEMAEDREPDSEDRAEAEMRAALAAPELGRD